MTVKELREKLAEMPEDLIVVQPRCQATSLHEELCPTETVRRQNVVNHDDIPDQYPGKRIEMLVIE